MARSIGFLSTHPPTHCGLATFNSSLVAQLRDERTTGVVRVVTGIDDVRPGPDVVHTWPAARPGGWREAADALNAYDVAVVQHEYGIYPGADGRDVVPLLHRLAVPSIVVLHTVLARPTSRPEAGAGARGQRGGRGRDHDRHGPRPAAARLRRRPREGQRHPARRPRVRDRRHRRPGRVAARQPPADLGTARAGQGHRMGAAGAGTACATSNRPRPTPSPAGPTPRCSSCTATRTAPASTGSARSSASRRSSGYESGYQDADTLGRLIRSADVVILPVRLPRAGHLRRPDRGGGRRRTRRRHPLPARGRAADRRARAARPAPRPGRAEQGRPADPDRARPGRHARRSLPTGDPLTGGPPWPSGTRRSPTGSASDPRRPWPPRSRERAQRAQPAQSPAVMLGRAKRGIGMTASGVVVAATGPDFAHLIRLTDDTGLFEHARHAIARRQHGYCTDDVARGLVVVSREPDPSPDLVRLAECYLTFLTHAQDGDGAFHNRLGHDRRWTDEPGLGDWWGRALWGLGTAAARSPLPWIRDEALIAFALGAGRRSPSPRAMAFAGLGAAEVLRADPGDRRRGRAAGRRRRARSAHRVGTPAGHGRDDRLTYANAALAGGASSPPATLRDDGALLAAGLRMLAWLRDVQTHRRAAVGRAGRRLATRRAPAPLRPAADRGRRVRRRLRHGRGGHRRPGLGGRRTAGGRLVPRRQRRRRVDVGSGHRRRLRRADRRTGPTSTRAPSRRSR